MSRSAQQPVSRRRLLLAAAAAIAGGALLAAAAMAAGHSQAGPRDGGTIRIALAGDPGTDPAFSASAAPSVPVLFHAICANLLNYRDPPRAGLFPEVAATLPRTSSDGKTYTFTIRNSYRFSNGARVTPQDVRFTLNRVLALTFKYLNVGVGGVNWMSSIEGEHAVARGNARAASGIELRGNKLLIHLVHPDAALPAKLAAPIFCILPRDTAVDPNNPVNKPTTAGPYYVASHAADQQIVLKRNPFYRGLRPRHVSSFALDANLDPDAQVQQVESGAADIAPAVDIGHALPLASRYGINKGRFRVDRATVTYYVVLNTSRKPFSSVALRRAANFAVDRPALVRAHSLSALSGTPTDQVLPPRMAGYRPIQAYPLRRPDVEKARRILRRAHERCGRVTVYARDEPRGERFGKVLKEDWAKIGCDVRVKLLPGGLLYAAISRRREPFDAAYAGWAADYRDPSEFFDFLLDGRTINATGNYNQAYLDVPRVNRLIERARRLAGRRRIHAYEKLDALITKTYAPWVAYMNSNEFTLLSKRVGGYIYQPVIGPDLAALYLK